MDSTRRAERDLREYENFLTQRPGESLQIPVVDTDIGGALISIASEGLYGDPRDALREYCQNSVDAQASTITIRFTGLNIAVIDDGRGMDFAALLAARRFGSSSKSALVDIGFRGIGIYSGFQICERLILVSQQARSDKRWTLTFDYAGIRRALAERRGDADVNGSLSRVIQDFTAVTFEQMPASSRSDKGSTIALLENIDPDAFGLLVDAEHLKAYLRNTLPVSLADDFKYKRKIEDYLLREIPEYRTVRVRLINDDIGSDDFITRTFPDNMLSPKFFEAAGPPEAPERQAIGWACMADRRKLKPAVGILFKKRGFTIGNGSELREKFANRPAVYDWYAGEVYVLQNAVIPNAARNGFERNVAFRSFWLALDSPMNGLLKDADNYSKFQRASEVVDEVEREFQALLNTVSDKSPLGAAIETLEKIQRLEVKLEAQKVPAQDAFYAKVRTRKAFLTNVIDQERDRLRSLIDRAEPGADSGTRPVDHDEDIAPKAAAKPRKETSAPRAAPASAAKRADRGLVAIFSRHGWSLDETARRALRVVEKAIDHSLEAQGSSNVLEAVGEMLDAEREAG